MNDLKSVGWLLTLTATSWVIAPTTLAATFGQQEVSQGEFVVVAVPRQDDYYSLLLIEQLSSSKDCWQESGSSPTQIEPLLLNFDFSGICGRSTDSNGYSMRQSGQDLGLKYRLSVQKRQDDVVLLGVPSVGQPGEAVEMGRTRGVEPGFLKIHLHSGWRLTKRTYDGKTLGHIYLTTDQPLEPASVAKARPSSSKGSRRLPRPNRSGRLIQASSSRSRPLSIGPSRSDSVYRIMVKTRDSQEQALVRRLVPDAFRSSYRGRSVMQVGLLDEKKTAVRLKRRLEDRDLDVFYVKEERRQAPIARTIPQTAVSSAGLLPVPGSSAPLGNASGNRRVATVLPPPPPASSILWGPRYRVVVTPRREKDRRKILKLVPDAFRSSYRGQSVLQVGSFKTQGEADDRIQLLERKGFDPILEKTQ
ncbi:MAG: DUF3747 domain-containing protein [Cyanobacteria bacterium P01_A01_bin.17]